MAITVMVSVSWLLMAILKTHQGVAIVDDDPHILKSIKADLARKFRTQVFADGMKVHGDDALVLSAHVAELEGHIIGDKGAVRTAAHSRHHGVQRPHRAQSPCRLRQDGAESGSAIDHEEACDLVASLRPQ